MLIDDGNKGAHPKEGCVKFAVAHQMGGVDNGPTEVVFLDNSQIGEQGPTKTMFSEQNSKRLRQFSTKIH